MYKKVLNYFVILAVSILTMVPMTSCGNDDNDDDDLENSWNDNDEGEDDDVNIHPDLEKKIVGKWQWTHITSWDKKDGIITNQFITEDISYLNYYYEFFQDGTMDMYEHGKLEYQGSYEFNNGILIIHIQGNDDNWNYSISGGKLTIKWYESKTEEGITYESYDEIVMKRVN